MISPDKNAVVGKGVLANIIRDLVDVNNMATKKVMKIRNAFKRVEMRIIRKGGIKIKFILYIKNLAKVEINKIEKLIVSIDI